MTGFKPVKAFFVMDNLCVNPSSDLDLGTWVKAMSPELITEIQLYGGLYTPSAGSFAE